MRFLILALLPLYAFAATTPTTSQDCLTIKNSLDRRYCLDKQLEVLKEKYEADKKAWSAGVTEETKNTSMDNLSTSIAAKKDHIALLQNEMALAEQQLATLKSANVVAAAPAAAAPAKKKKKDKRLIRFKF